MPLTDLLIIFATGAFAGTYGTLVGACSLVTIPVLIFIGLPPHLAIGTNRIGIVGMTITGWYKFHQQKQIDYRVGAALAVTALVGSFLGVKLVVTTNDELIRYIVAIFTLVILAVVMAKPGLGVVRQVKKISARRWWLTLTLSFFFGVYGGFYGAGVGTFFSYLLVFGFGQTFIGSAATRKIPMSFLSAVAGIGFVWYGLVNWPLAVALFAGYACGSYLGSHYAETLGNVWLKRLFAGVVIIMAVKLFF